MKILVRILIVVIALFIFSSCVLAPRKRPPQKASADIQKLFEMVEIDLATGANEKALSRLKQLIQSSPNSDLTDDAYIKMGEIYYKQHEFSDAYNSFMGVVNSEVFSPREAFALLWSSKSLVRLGRMDEALSLTHRILKIRGLSKDLRTDTVKLRFSLLSQVGDRIDALKALIYLSENEENTSLRETAHNKALDFVESRLNQNELTKVANSSSFGFVRGHAMFRVGLMFFEQRDFWEARDYLSNTIKLLPDSDLAEQAKDKITQIDARRSVQPKTIGAILPLSGRYSHVAYKTLRGIQLGLGIYGKNSSDFKLAIIDSEGNPDIARRAVERLVTEDHVIAIIGSLLSKTSIAVASKADELGVPSIALSQKAGLTEIGSNVYRNALTSEMQVRQLVHVAMNDLGYKKFAVLYPNDAYGVEYTNLFWDEVLARGGEIRGVQAYTPGETDFNSQIQKLVGTYYIEGRVDEYRLRMKNWYQNRKILSSRVKPPEDLLPPIVDFDAIFIPDNSKTLGQIAPTLAYNDVRKIRLLGTNLWNTSSLIKRGKRYINNAVFVDSLLINDKSFTQSKFFNNFYSAFNKKPGLFEAQAYDAALVLRQIIASGERSRSSVSNKLSEVNSFPGSIGKLNMTSRREVLRPIVSLTVDKGKIRKFDPKKHKDIEDKKIPSAQDK